MKLIYLASPYTHSRDWVRDARWRHACFTQGRLMLEYPDCCFYGPIAMNHMITEIGREGVIVDDEMIRYDIPTDCNYWQSACEKIISKCDELWILKITGWDKSLGVAQEIAYAASINIPIYYISTNNLSKEYEF